MNAHPVCLAPNNAACDFSGPVRYLVGSGETSPVAPRGAGAPAIGC